jgi:hypothetical protein
LEACTIRFEQQAAAAVPVASSCAHAPADGSEPLRKLLGRAAIGGRERTDHAIRAGGNDEVDARDAEHRRRDQRQAQALKPASSRVKDAFLGE